MDQLCTSGGSDNDKSLAAGDEPAVRVRGEVQAQAAAPAEAQGGGCFDCNICLDFATEPVVTLCGHLFCWPCIYEWLDPGGGDGSADGRNGDASSTRRRPCPVCKAAVSPDSLVPLYGRGRGRSSKRARSGSVIPRRPTVHREPVERQSDRRSDHGGGGHRHGSTGPSSPVRSPWRANHHAAAAAAASAPARFDVVYPPPPAAVGGVSMFHSTTTTGGMLGGMALAVLPWVSRGQAPASAYYPSPYHMSPRLRRQHMEVERSLHQIWFFLVVFAVLCLLLF